MRGGIIWGGKREKNGKLFRAGSSFTVEQPCLAVLRRLDCVLEPSSAVLAENKAALGQSQRKYAAARHGPLFRKATLLDLPPKWILIFIDRGCAHWNRSGGSCELDLVQIRLMSAFLSMIGRRRQQCHAC